MGAMVVARKVSIACVVAVGALAGGGRALGETDAPIFRVEINATQPDSYVHVRGAGRDLPCGDRCVLDLPRRDYSVIVRDIDGNESAHALTVVRPTSLTVSPGNHDKKLVGIGLFAGGVAAVAVGVGVLYLTWVDSLTCRVDSCVVTKDEPAWRWYAGGISVAAGLGLGAAGLILWRSNAHAVIGIAPAAGPQLAGLRLTGRF